MTLDLYHATGETQATAIVREGFRLDVPRRRDPGDFGLAVYLTSALGRARAMDRVVLRCEVTLANPLHFASMAAAYSWLDSIRNVTGNTCRGTARTAAALLVAAYAVARGYDGLVIDSNPPGSAGWNVAAEEVVVYDPAVVRVVKVVELDN